MYNAIGSWNIAFLYCGAANVDMSFMISPNSYRFPTEGLNTIGERPGCGTHTHTAESLCNRNIWVHDQQIFDMFNMQLQPSFQATCTKAS
jgi:hypothetical protein